MGSEPGFWDGSRSFREKAPRGGVGHVGGLGGPEGMESGLGEGSGYPGGAGLAYRAGFSDGLGGPGAVGFGRARGPGGAEPWDRGGGSWGSEVPGGTWSGGRDGRGPAGRASEGPESLESGSGGPDRGPVGGSSVPAEAGGASRGWGDSGPGGKYLPGGRGQPGTAGSVGRGGLGASAAAETVGEGRAGAEPGGWRGAGPWGRTGDDAGCRALGGKKAFLSKQCKNIEENDRIGKTSDLFKKIGDTKGIFHAKMGTIKDRNGKDLTEEEAINKRWQEYTEELHKKDLNNLDNHDGVIIH